MPMIKKSSNRSGEDEGIVVDMSSVFESSLIVTPRSLRSMNKVRAVDGMYQERTQIFATFGVGLMSTVGAAIFASLIIMRIEAAAACSLVLLYCAHRIYTQVKWGRGQASLPVCLLGRSLL